MSPDVKRAFKFSSCIRLGQAVGVLGGIEAALGTGQIVLDVLEDVAGHFCEGFFARLLIGRQVRLASTGAWIIEHFFEVRHVPFGIDGVAVEAAAEVIVHAARGHFAQGVDGHAAGDIGILS